MGTFGVQVRWAGGRPEADRVSHSPHSEAVMEATWVAMQDPTYLLILFFVLFGLACVSATFFIMMPIVANVIGGVWTAIMQEQIIAKLRGKVSGTELPPDHPARANG